MNEPEIPGDERFDECLLAPSDPPRDDSLRRSVLAQTNSVLRRRRIVRRAGWIAAFAGCYLAGIGTMQAIWHLRREAPPIAETQPVDTAPIVPLTQTEPAEERIAAVVRRSSASQRTRSSFEVLRAAGDRSLNEYGDLRAAISYYRQAVKRASRQELETSAANDNWLLQSLKQDRLQEVNNERRNG